MDSSLVWIFALIALIVILLVARPLLRRWAKEKGAERTVGKKQDQTGPDALGATLLLGTDIETARSIVAPLLETRKRVTVQPDGSWAKTHYNDDDIIYAVSSAPTGSLVAVIRAIEFAGTVNGVKEWQALRGEIARAATERGVSVGIGGDQLVPAAPLVPNGPQVWARPAV